MKKLNKTSIAIIIATLAFGIFLGWLIFNKSDEIKSEEHNHATTTAAETIWTCSMHPQIRKNEPGKCPICGMELIPLESADGAIDPMAVSMSPTAMQLARVQTMVVGNGSAGKTIRLNGKVLADERLLFTQSSHIPGRIEKLSLNFTGDYVSQGQIIAYIYSPDLVTAQQELFEAHKIKETQPALFAASKEKLKNWKLTDKQIEQIIESNKTMEQFPILANVSGYVTKKMVNLGDYVKQGDALFEIADLSKVWVLFDVYESDMSWIKKGAAISFSIQSIPGKTFKTTISYVDPVIDPKTRVAYARVEVMNSELKLKPEMFASGTVESNSNNKTSAIIVPKTAVMWTGKRSVVYVMNTTAQAVSFLMREVTLGPAMGESYVVDSGLQAGEEIAVNGTFSIDAAAQLAGKPSMMNPEGGVAITGHNHGGSSQIATVASHKSVPVTDMKSALQPLFEAYFELKKALASDDLEKARNAGKAMNAALGNVDMNLFKGDTHNIWMKLSSDLQADVQHAEHLGDIKDIRAKFIAISKDIIAMAESFGPFSEPYYVQHCPMADSNKGADWLSKDKEILNPYFGKAMLTCGEITKTI